MSIITYCECEGCGDRLVVDGGDEPHDTVTIMIGSMRGSTTIFKFSGHLCDQCVADLKVAVDPSRWPKRMPAAKITIHDAREPQP